MIKKFSNKIYQNIYKLKCPSSNQLNTYKFQVSNLYSNNINELLGNNNNLQIKNAKVLDSYKFQAKHFTLSINDNLIMYGRLIPNSKLSQLYSISNGKLKLPKEVTISKTAEISNYYIHPSFQNCGLEEAMVFYQSKYSLDNNITTLISSLNVINQENQQLLKRCKLIGFKEFDKQYPVFTNRIGGILSTSKFNFVNLQPIYKNLSQNRNSFDSLIKLSLLGKSSPILNNSIKINLK